MSRWIVAATVLALAVAGGACRKAPDPANPAEMKEKLASKLDWVLPRVDVTPAQEKRIDGLLDRLAPDLFAFQEENTALKRRIIGVLSQEAVDPAALATVRKDGTDLFDRYMARMSDAAVAASGILTAEQRLKLVGMWRAYEFSGEE